MTRAVSEAAGERVASGVSVDMDLDRRKRDLLQTIVVAYVESAEPVGSQFLASQPSLGVRSATIRNELAEMTMMGYLRQPHTSAGRVPTEQGYRYYVDHLMSWARLGPVGVRALRGAQRISAGDVEALLYQTCRVLSSLTQYTAVATLPSTGEPTVRKAHVISVSASRLLAVVVLDGGQVVHRFLDVKQALTPAEVTRLSNALDERVRGASPSSLCAEARPCDELGPLDPILRSLIEVLALGVSGDDSDLMLGGASHILEQPEFREANRVEPLIRFLEERRTAFQTLRSLLARRALTVSIGSENSHDALRDVSFVAARYATGGAAEGWVGVLGPTRMHYDQAVSAVQFAAQSLTEALSRSAGE